MKRIMLLLLKVRVHSLTLLLIVLSVLTARIGELAITLLVVVGHELGHACMASLFNWKINQINILPFGGELDTDNFGVSPIREEFIVVIAGPIFNIIVAVILIFLTSENSNYYVEFFMRVNLVVLIANLLPIWPLDGGKLLHIALSLICPFREAFKRTLILSSFLTILLSVVFLLLGVKLLNGWIFIAFLVFAIWRGFKQKEFLFYRFLLSKKSGKWLGELKVDSTNTVIEVVRKLRKDRNYKICVMKNNECIGMLDEEVVIELLLKKKLFNTEIGSCIL